MKCLCVKMATTEIQWILLMLLFSVYTEAQNGIEYTFSESRATWNQAHSFCKERSSTLLTLKTEEKFKTFEHLHNLLKANGTITGHGQWLGLYDSDPPNQKYTWTDCCPFSPLFSLWDNTDEPDNPESQQCVRMNRRFGWRSYECETTTAFTCERDVGSCWFEQVEGKLDNIDSNLDAVSLHDCQSKCLTRSTCMAVQFSNNGCQASGSDEIIPITKEFTYIKICSNYTVTYAEFDVETPPLQAATVVCNSVSTIIPDLQSTFISSAEDTEASPMTTTIQSTLTSTAGDIKPSPLTTELQSSTDSTADDIEVSLMTTVGHIEASWTAEHFQSTFNPLVDDIEGSSMASDFDDVSSSFHQTLSGIAVSPLQLPSASSPAQNTWTVSTTGELGSTVIVQSASTEPGQPTTERTNATTFRSVTVQCTCVCKEPPGRVEEKVSSITKELILNTTSLSSYVRRKTSAKDSRTSAQASGALGIVVFVLSGLGLVFMDAITLVPKICGKFS